MHFQPSLKATEVLHTAPDADAACAAVTSLVLLHHNKQQQERIHVHTVVTDVLTAKLASSSVSKAAVQGQLDRAGLELQEAKAELSALSEQYNIVRQQLESDMAAEQDQLKNAAAIATNNSTPTIHTQLLLSPPNTPSAGAATAAARASLSESSSPASRVSSATPHDVSQAAELHPSTLLVAKKQPSRKAAQRKATLRTTKVIIPRWRW